MFFKGDGDSLKSKRRKRMEELEEMRELRENAHLEKWDGLALVIAAFMVLLPIVGGIILVYYLFTWLFFC